jgi:hypothetical protein
MDTSLSLVAGQAVVTLGLVDTELAVDTASASAAGKVAGTAVGK